MGDGKLATGIWRFVQERAGREFLLMVIFNQRSQIVGVGEVPLANVTAAAVRSAFKGMPLAQARGLLSIYNQQDARPQSSQNAAMTERLKRVAKQIGVPLLDHLIFCNGHYHSMAPHVMNPFVRACSCMWEGSNLGGHMGISEQWWVFADAIIESESDSPGVYELGNTAGEVIYIGSSDELRRRLKDHWNEAANTCVKMHTVRYRVEYRSDFLVRERELFDEHVKTYGAPPMCNAAAL